MDRRTFLTTGVATVSGCSSAFETGPDVDLSKVEQNVRDQMIEIRTENGRGLLATDETLTKIARYHAEDMMEQSYIGLVSPTGETFADRYQKFDYSCGDVPVESDGPRVGNAVLAKLRFESGEYTESELAEMLLDRWRKQSRKRGILLSKFWNTDGIGAAATETRDGRIVVYVAVYFC